MWRNEANIVYKNGADYQDCIQKVLWYSFLYRFTKEGALTRSHEPIIMIEEAMLDEHISFKTIGGSK